MSSIIKKIEQKFGDHPNVSADPDVNPTSGTGIGANQGDGECAEVAPCAMVKADTKRRSEQVLGRKQSASWYGIRR